MQARLPLNIPLSDEEAYIQSPKLVITKCPLCPKGISALSPPKRRQHVNKCIDSAMLTESAGIDWHTVPLCPSCDKPWQSSFTLSTKLFHMRQCCQLKGKDANQIVQMVRDKVSAQTKSSQLFFSLSNRGTQPLSISLPSTTHDAMIQASAFASQATHSKYFSKLMPHLQSPEPLIEKAISQDLSLNSIDNVSNLSSPTKANIPIPNGASVASIIPSINPTKKQIEVITISSDEDFVAQRIPVRRIAMKAPLSTNKTNLNLAKAMSLSLAQPSPLVHAELVSKRRKKVAIDNALLVGSPSTAYTESKIRSLKVFALSNSSKPDALNQTRSEGLRNLSVLPPTHFVPFFEPYKTEITINTSCTAKEIENAEYQSRANQTRAHYTSRIKQLEDEMEVCLDTIEQDRIVKVLQLEQFQRDAPMASPKQPIIEATHNIPRRVDTTDSPLKGLSIPESDQECTRATNSSISDGTSIIKSSSAMSLNKASPYKVAISPLAAQPKRILLATALEVTDDSSDKENDPTSHASINSLAYSPINMHKSIISPTGSMSSQLLKSNPLKYKSQPTTESSQFIHSASTESQPLEAFRKQVRAKPLNSNDPLRHFKAKPIQTEPLVLVNDDVYPIQPDPHALIASIHQQIATIEQVQESEFNLHSPKRLPQNFRSFSRPQLIELATEFGAPLGKKCEMISALALLDTRKVKVVKAKKVQSSSQEDDPDDDDLWEKVHAFLKKREGIWSKIVRYEMLLIEETHAAFATETKCTRKAFGQVLDGMGIHYAEEIKKVNKA